MAALDVSILVPVFNDAGTLEELHARLTRALDDGSRRYEVILVDDGSTDGSFEVLATLHRRDPRVRVVRLASNFGQHAALVAGAERARGRVLISLDADLQLDPSDVPKLLAKIEEGYDLVSGWRVGRKDGLLTRRLPSWLVSRTLSLVTGFPLRDATSPFKAVRRELVGNLSQYGEMRRFLSALALRMGRSVAEVPVSHCARAKGRSQYSFLDLFAGYLDLVVAFWPRMFQIVALLGLLCLAAGSLGAILYLVLRFLLAVPLGNRTQVVVFALLFAGFQFTILGLLGEFTARIYRLVQNRPLYVVRETLG